MFSFEIVPQVSLYDSVAAFSQALELGEKDLIITNQFIFDPFIKPLDLPCSVIFQEQYGSGEPTDVMIDQVKAVADQKAYDRVIAIGGGTVIDIGKVLVLDGQWTTADLFERKAPIQKTRKLIVVPTTCGTGSEVTSITIVGMTQKKTKLGLNARELYPDMAVLIPDMLHTLPYKFFATSSIDALIHAVESYVSPKANPYNELFGVKAMELIIAGYKKIRSQGQSAWIQDAKEYLLASNFAGIAFNNAGVGAVHAMSYPLGGEYHIAHGEANHLMFTEVFKTYHSKKPDGRIRKLEEILAYYLECDINNVWQEMETLLDAVLHKKALREYGIEAEILPAIAVGVIETQQRLLANNYVELTAEEMTEIYQRLH